MDVNQSIVSRTWSCFLETGNFVRRRSQGRRRVTNRRTDREIVRTVLNNSVITENQVIDEVVVRRQKTRVNNQTIRLRLHEANLRSRNRVHIPALILNHRRACLEYAQTYVQ